jgi:TolB protein
LPFLGLGWAAEESMTARNARRALLAASAQFALGLAVGGTPALAAFPGDNGRIVFASAFRDGCCEEEQIDIWTMSPSGTNVVNLTSDSQATDFLGRWSPDGRRIVFQSDRETPGNPTPPGFPGPDLELFAMNADGSNVSQLTFNELDDEAPAWSPNGKRLVFQRDFDPVKGQVDYDVLTMDLDGGHERNLTRSPGVNDGDPNWAPQGGRIALDSDRDGDSEIYAMNPSGTQVKQLTSNQGVADYGPNWSPDGKQIAFTTDRLVTDEVFNLEVFAMRADGSRQVNLSRHPFVDEAPAWSPDGRNIAFHTDRDSAEEKPFNFEIYTMRADGGSQVNRTNNPAFDGFPDWQPLPKQSR